MKTVSNEHLEHYADRFALLRLARHGVTLAQYLANVDRFERLALEPEPPLPAQQAAILRLWAEQDTGLADRPAEPVQPELGEHDAWRDLLAGLRAEAAYAERAVAHLPQRNGAIVEPLHHHRHPRRAGSGVIKRGES